MDHIKFLAGLAGFGPTNARVKVWCLTAWLQPSISNGLGWVIGVEPMTFGATNRRSNQLSYTHHMARLKRLELLAHCLEGSCSIRLSYRRMWSGWWESNPHNQLGRLMFYHWTTPAQSTLSIIADSVGFVNTFLIFFLFFSQKLFLRQK